MIGTWTSIALDSKTVDVYEPAPLQNRPRFGVLFLHDIDGQTLRDRPAFCRLFDELKLACACPPGRQSWWSDRVGSDFDPQVSAERWLLQSVLPFFMDHWRLPARSVGLLGIGMGGQGALRLAFKHAARFPVVAAIAPALDYHELYGSGTPLDDLYDSKEQCRQDTALLHVPPHDYPPHIFFCIDPEDRFWYRGNDRLHEKLCALGVPHTCDLFSRSGGHSWSYFDQAADRTIRFLHAGLEYESRRLL